MAHSAFTVRFCAALAFSALAAALSSANVEWMVRPLLTNVPQTPAEVAYGAAHGRAPGPLEFFQPPIDAVLSSYSPVSANLSGEYTFAASDVLAVLSKSSVAEFMKIYPGVNISIPPPYAGSVGALELVNGTLDGVFVSRELKPSDISSFAKTYGYNPTSIPIGGGSYRQFGFLDGLAFIVNKQNPIESLTFEQLDSIFSTTRHRGGPPITKWEHLGIKGDFGDKDIKIYGIQPWNGFEEFVRQRVLSVGNLRGEWRSGNTSDPKYDDDVYWETTVFKTAGLVVNDTSGIGYAGFAYIDNPVKVLALAPNSTATPIAGTYKNVALAEYPLSRVFYFNINKAPGKAFDPVLKELIYFILSKQGQKLILDQGIFLPLRRFQQISSLDQVVSAP